MGAEDEILSGYRDDFPKTAPVGSFAANRLGLFDLGGNIREYCEDWFDAEQRLHVLRDASYTYGTRDFLVSSYRGPTSAAGRAGDVGFRVVLAADKAP